MTTLLHKSSAYIRRDISKRNVELPVVKALWPYALAAVCNVVRTQEIAEERAGAHTLLQWALHISRRLFILDQNRGAQFLSAPYTICSQ